MSTEEPQEEMAPDDGEAIRDDAPPPPQLQNEPKQKSGRPKKPTISMEDLQSQYLSQIHGESWQVQVIRREPNVYQGVKVRGLLGVFNEPVDRSDILNTFGGGTFQIAIYKPREDGAHGYQAVRFSEMFDISGVPKVKGVAFNRNGQAPTSNGDEPEAHPSVTKELLGKFSDMTERYVNQAGRRGGNDTDTIRLIKETFEEMVRSKEKEVDQMREDARSGGGGAKLLETITAHSQANLQMINTAHEAQLTHKDDQHQREIDALRRELEAVRTEADRRARELVERADRDLRDVREDERRERENLTRQHERELTNAKQMLGVQFESTKGNLDTRITHLERDLTLAKAESNDYKRRLEEAGDISKQVERMHGLHEVLSDTFGSGAGDGLQDALEDAPGWVRGLAGLANTQLGAKIGEGIAGVVASRGAIAQQQQHAAPQPPRPMLSQSARVQAGMAAAAAPPRGQTQDDPPDPAIWKVLGTRVEEAMEKGVPPTEFANFVRANTPGPELVKVLRLGLEQIYGLILQVAAPDNAIKSPAGKSFMKAVYEALKAPPMVPPVAG